MKDNKAYNSKKNKELKVYIKQRLRATQLRIKKKKQVAQNPLLALIKANEASPCDAIICESITCESGINKVSENAAHICDSSVNGASPCDSICEPSSCEYHVNESGINESSINESSTYEFSSEEVPVQDSAQNSHQNSIQANPIQARFILDELLGTGGVCEVFKALDLRRVEWGDKNPYVAIKRLIPQLVNDPKAQACLIQEFYTVRSLNHQGIIRFFDIHKEPWGMCCSMELLQGTNLRDYIIDNPLGKGKAAYNTILNLLNVVAFIHERNIAHGDIKPANIFLEANDKVVLFDFNVSYVGDKDDANCAKAQRIFQSKNPNAHCSRYSSPEQSRTGIVSIDADIFSVACCIYQFFQGSHPFDTMNEESPETSLNRMRKPDYMAYSQWYVLKLAMNNNPKKRPSAKTMIKCFKQPFAFFYVVMFFCKNTFNNVNNFALEILAKLKRLKKD